MRNETEKKIHELEKRMLEAVKFVPENDHADESEIELTCSLEDVRNLITAMRAAHKLAKSAAREARDYRVSWRGAMRRVASLEDKIRALSAIVRTTRK